jgi:dolichol-phosphate mannosyltransferase
MKPSLTIVIPSLNEEAGLQRTVALVLEGIGRHFTDYEVLIINDGSRDRTGAMADQLAAENHHIRTVHHQENMGLGYSYREGIQLATKEYIGWIPGDCGGLTSEADLSNILEGVGRADIVLVYLLSENRPWQRQLISRTYTKILNLLFGLNLKYYNGGNIYRRELLKDVPMKSKGYGLFAEILVQLVKSGHSYFEVGMHNRERAGGQSKAFRLKNCFRVGRAIASLFWRVQIVGAIKRRQSSNRHPLAAGQPRD